jgi:hypothetical protein
MARESDRDRYYEPDWTARRHQARTRRSWYDGTPLMERMGRREREEGNKVRKFPLGLNLVGLACDVHRDFARGIKDDNDLLVVRASVDRTGDPERGTLIEEVINEGIWVPSHGGPMQQEALLEMNIYGACVMQITWEPWEKELPYRTAVRLIRDPSSIDPIWNNRNPWRLEEVYIGYELDHDAARAIYNIEPHSEAEKPLYMEHWTKSEWIVRVDDQVPVMKWDGKEWPLRGENPWGFVPVYYVPHERTTSLFGDGEIGDEDIVKEINARAADISDIVRAAWPGMLYARDVERVPNVSPVMVDGDVVFKILNLGRTRNVTGANPPTIGPIPTPDIPDSLVGWSRELLSFWQLAKRISPAVFGMDDTQSGRITGPAVEARMVSSTNHAITERTNLSDALSVIDQDLVHVLAERESSGAFGELEIEGPGFVEQDAQRRIVQKWYPMLPQDTTEEFEQWLNRLKEGGSSIEEFLKQMGVEDIEGEKQLIMDWLDYQAELEAKAQPQPFGGGDGAGSTS